MLAHAEEKLPEAVEEKTATSIKATEAIVIHDEKDAASDDGKAEEKPTAVSKVIVKCNVCDQRFKTLEEAQSHATEFTDHVDFSEVLDSSSATMTLQERAAKMARLKELIAERRSAKEIEAQEEERQRELMRRKTGKDLGEIRQEMEERETQKALEARKRERAEDQAARARILAQIDEDRRIKRERDEQAKKAAAVGPISIEDDMIASSVVKQPHVVSDMARLHIRIPDAPPVKLTLPASTTLRQVLEQVPVSKNRHGPKVFVPVPLRNFSPSSDYDRTLAELDLTPSATLHIQE